MRILITGVCGFVGTTLALVLRQSRPEVEIVGIDNFSRPGSEVNRGRLREQGVRVIHADIRLPSDFQGVGLTQWVIDAAANPSVLAGIDGHTSSRQVVEHNLLGTANILEYCRRAGAGFILLSTSRVYSIPSLAQLPLVSVGNAFALDSAATLPVGISERGVRETFSTEAPLSLYGATKRASEQLALEYGHAFGFPVWINRCGVLAGAGQFARADQGIFAYWIHSWAAKRSLRYIGYGGYQVRDCLHPRDLAPLLEAQMADSATGGARTYNISGGLASASSLRGCSDWCERRFGPLSVEDSADTRAYDLPWVVLDHDAATSRWGWMPAISRETIFEAIAAHAEGHPEWLGLSSA